MEKVFTDIYEKCVWGDNQSGDYSGSSGPGSDAVFNGGIYVPFLKHFIAKNHVSSVVDLGCGDFRCGPFIYGDLDVTYTGYDTYKKIIIHNVNNHPPPKYHFVHLDFFNCWDDITGGDLCILKDVLQHWNLGDIYNFLDFLCYSQRFKFILLCNCGNQTQDNTDVESGGFRPLSSKYLPLRRYNPKELLIYNEKEVSLIGGKSAHLPDTPLTKSNS